MATEKKLTPVAKASGAGRRVKPQGEKNMFTWERFEETLVAAAKLQGVVENKWVLCTDIAWGLGVRAKDLDKVKDAKGNMVASDMWIKVAGIVTKAFSIKEQALINSPQTGLDSLDRETKRTLMGRRDSRVQTVREYLQKHEDLERNGPKERKTFGQSVADILKGQIDRIKKKKVNKEEDVDFDDARVIELLNEAIAELT